MIEPDETTQSETLGRRLSFKSHLSAGDVFDLASRCQLRPPALAAWSTFVVLTFAATLAMNSTQAMTLTLAREIGPSKIDLIDGSTIDGAIKSIDRDGKVVGDGIPDGLNFSNILLIQTQRKTQSNADFDVMIYPVGGGKLKASNPSVSDEKTLFQSTVGAHELPLQSVRAIVWTSSPGVIDAIKEPSTENDKVIVETADGERIVEGILEGIDSEHVHINYKGESRKIGLAKIKAVVTADLGLAKTVGSTATVNLIDGSQVIGVISELADGVMQAQVDGDAFVGLRTETIVNITISSDRVQYLSDADPVDVQEKSVFAVQRSWTRDRSVENKPLTIGLDSTGKTINFNKGLGTQAFSRLEFANNNQFDRFSAIVGIDVETDGRGDCQVVVRGDGIELWAQRVRASDEPHKLDLDIAGIKKIALIVYPGEEFDLGDHVDWGDARFLKTK